MTKVTAAGFSTTQLIIAIVVSVVGTSVLSAVVFMIVYKVRRRRTQAKTEQGKSGSDSSSSSSAGSGDVVYFGDKNVAEQPQVIVGRRPHAVTGPEYEDDESAPRLSSHSSLQRRVDWPFSVDESLLASPATVTRVSVHQSPVQPKIIGPLTSNSIYDTFSLFPKEPVGIGRRRKGEGGKVQKSVFTV